MTTNTPNDINSHIRIRQCNSRLFDCEKCVKPFKTMSSMRQHISSFHSNKIDKYQCNKCGKHLKSIVNLRMHRRYRSFDITLSMRYDQQIS